MRITEAIEKADHLYPNHFNFAEKLDWCYFVTSMLLDQVSQIYDTYDYPYTGAGEAYYLPQGVLFEDVVYVYVNGQKYTKTDNRSFGICQFIGTCFTVENITPITLKVVYKQRFPMYQELQLMDTDVVLTANTITLVDHRWTNPQGEGPFDVGDNLLVTIGGAIYDVNVLAVDDNTITVRDDAFPVTGALKADIELVIQDWTVCSPPYDRMYVDYILSQAAFYQNDMEEYNKHTVSFNNMVDSYTRYYMQNQPADQSLKITNRW